MKQAHDSKVHDLKVHLPPHLQAAADDLEVLRTTFQTIITLTSECQGGVNPDLRCLQDKGWQVGWGLTWIARASKGKQYEEATAGTKEEALAQLRQLVGLHDVEGCP